MAEFSNDLERGLFYEELFYKEIKEIYPEKEIKHLNKEFEADFEINSVKVELKSDFTKYTNFFMEIFSNYATRRRGGPWQAHGYKAKYFLYWFCSDENINQWSCYSFEVDELVSWLDINMYSYPMKFVNNGKYNTFGCPVPIKDLEEFPWCRKQTIVSSI
jgi:hypothetical protein